MIEEIVSRLLPKQELLKEAIPNAKYVRKIQSAKVGIEDRFYVAVMFVYWEKLVISDYLLNFCGVIEELRSLAFYANFVEPLKKTINELQDCKKKEGIPKALAMFFSKINSDLGLIKLLVKLAKMLVITGVQQACNCQGIPDISPQIEIEYLTPEALPGPICKRALSFALRIGISEISDKKYEWKPEFAGKKYSRQDNLNFHSDAITICLVQDDIYLAYTNFSAGFFINQADELLLANLYGICTKCKQRFDQTTIKAKLRCGHEYHKEHLIEHLSTQTHGLFVLNPDEESKIKPKCADNSCEDPYISQDEIKEILSEKYGAYKAKMEERTSERLWRLKCCNKDLDANKYAQNIKELLDFSEKSKVKYIECVLGCKNAMNEGDLMGILGDKRFKEILSNTCGGCGKVMGEVEGRLSCTHSFCVSCAKEKLLDGGEDNVKYTLGYNCVICREKSKLREVKMDKSGHMMNIGKLFIYTLKDPAFDPNADPNNLRIKCAYKECQNTIDTEVISLVRKLSASKEEISKSPVKNETLDNINKSLEGTLGFAKLKNPTTVRIFCFAPALPRAEKKVREFLQEKEVESYVRVVPKGTAEFKMVEQKFQQSMPGVPIQKLEQILNCPLKQQYNVIVNKYPGGQVKQLFCGIANRISEAAGREALEGVCKNVEGFNVLLYNGKFIPFFIHAKDASTYATNEGGLKQIFLADVFLGKMKQIGSLAELNENVLKQNVDIDSFYDNKNQYAIYRNEYANPSYLIHF